MSTDPHKKPTLQAGGVFDHEAAVREFVLAKDRRFALGAYMFLFEALSFTQERLKRNAPELDAAARHVTGQELLAGIRDYAFQHFGPLAPAVFRSWGVNRSEDFGEMVFNLVEEDLLGKTDEDSREDFANGFDFDTAFDGDLEVRPG